MFGFLLPEIGRCAADLIKQLLRKPPQTTDMRATGDVDQGSDDAHVGWR